MSPLTALAGPRQVGKSTLIDQVLEECTLPHYLYNADGVDENDTDWIRRVWESARIQMDTRQQTEAILVIDEIQKIKRWSEIVKRERSDEVDYIVASQGTAIALEVKSGRRGMNSRLPKFCENFHPRRALVIGTDGIPFKEFFHMKIEDLL
jgi:predicted AAA+ superfamily ATPase